MEAPCKVLVYEIHDENESVIVFFNPTHEQFYYRFEQPYELLYYNAKCEHQSLHEIQIEPISTIVLVHSLS